LALGRVREDEQGDAGGKSAPREYWSGTCFWMVGQWGVLVRGLYDLGVREGVTAASRDLLGLQGGDAGELRALLGSAWALECDRGVMSGALAGVTVVNLFFEDSTRTRVSFTMAAQALGASVVQFGSDGSSASKGESLLDTARTIEAMGAGALVVRHASAGAAKMISDRVEVPVLNAGDGAHEHPTQGLLDILALAEAHGRTGGFDLSGLRVVIVGDIAHSRVARSAVAGMTALGARVTCVGPESLCPDLIGTLGCAVELDLDAVIGEADAVMALRMQFERGTALEGLNGALGGGSGAYTELYGLTAERAGRMKPGAVVMHPGPLNRGIEIESSVADGVRSVILRQVALGVPVRMAALAWCVRGEIAGG